VSTGLWYFFTELQVPLSGSIWYCQLAMAKCHPVVATTGYCMEK